MFVLAHLSDPHIAPLPTPSPTELVGKRALGFINWRRKRGAIHLSAVLERILDDLDASAPGHIGVTGDLVNISLPTEFAPARSFLQRLGPPSEVTLVPGNHDAYVRAAADYPQLHWGDYMRGDEAPAAGPDTPTFPFVRRRGPLALIGLSSAVPSLPMLAVGRLGKAQLQRLADILRELGRAPLFRIVLIHHPPLSKRSHYFKRLVDGDALREVLARHGAELVIHGHDHRHSLSWLAGPKARIPVAGVPSASAAPHGEHDGGGYNLYRIEASGSGWRCEMISRGLDDSGAHIVERRRLVLA
jgi:3',5'-cyclic AMP phosphodiesterase CpdA